MAIEVILDASAVLASINREPGGDVVDSVFDDAAISAINLAEVVSKLVDNGLTIEDIEAVIRDLPCEVIDFDEAAAISTGLLRSVTRANGLSLADRACLVLACREGVPALTADRAWARLDLGVEIRMLR